MGLMEKWEWANGYGRKRCRGLLWRVRAAVKAVAGCKDVSVRKKQVCSKFQYDPWSYALNFDDGSKNYGGKADAEPDSGGDAILVYVIWVKTK